MCGWVREKKEEESYDGVGGEEMCIRVFFFQEEAAIRDRA